MISITGRQVYSLRVLSKCSKTMQTIHKRKDIFGIFRTTRTQLYGHALPPKLTHTHTLTH